MEKDTKHSSNLYKYPRRKDELWVPMTDLLMTIPDEPEPHGKSQRMLKGSSVTLKTIQDTINEYQEDHN